MSGININDARAIAIEGCTFGLTTELAALLEIWKIVHTPTKDTGHRAPNSHFAADFDAIRKIIKPFVELSDTVGK